MAIFKCKMCGGSLEITDGATVCECEYCGTQQTLPKTGNEVTANLFNRANNLRMKCEFDKAQEVYEKIVSADPSDSEAFWGLILCKYGIEYVEDPATFKKVPTCHRTQLESVLSDVDYQSAIENADTAQKSLYEAEAREIDRLQKEILAIVQNEKPFDVFICYKESDENGKRTPDSVIANDIYHQLTQEGFKVFYAAITLEDKLGQAYEPYIFAALNSAKVMLSIGTKPEYFNSVWVKNEWSRYLKIMKNDRSRLLIPCYKDMDAYDLPEEFSHLQAQDMGKIGFINDLIRGIKKVIVKDEPVVKTVVQQTVSAPVNSNVENLLKRGNLALEDGKWEEADNFFEQVLNENVEEPRAYLGKLMVNLKLHTEDEFAKLTESFADNDNYKRAIRFSDNKFNEKLNNYNMCAIYNNAQQKMDLAKDETDYLNAKEIFTELKGFQDADKKVEECEKHIYFIAADIIKNSSDINKYHTAKKLFENIIGYSDVDVKIEECNEQINLLNKLQEEIKEIELKQKDLETQKNNFVFKGPYDSEIAEMSKKIFESDQVNAKREKYAQEIADLVYKKNMLGILKVKEKQELQRKIDELKQFLNDIEFSDTKKIKESLQELKSKNSAERTKAYNIFMENLRNQYLELEEKKNKLHENINQMLNN